MGIVTGPVGQRIQRERLGVSVDSGGREPARVNHHAQPATRTSLLFRGRFVAAGGSTLQAGKGVLTCPISLPARLPPKRPARRSKRSVRPRKKRNRLERADQVAARAGLSALLCRRISYHDLAHGLVQNGLRTSILLWTSWSAAVVDPLSYI